MKRLIALCLALLLLCGCTMQPPPSTAKILFIPKSQLSSFWKITIDGFYTAVAEYNIEGVMNSTLSEEDVVGQCKLVREAPEQGYDAIILSANSYEGLADAVREVMDQGVEVVVIDSDVNVPEIDVRISTDNYLAGFEMGEAMAELLDYEGEVGMLAFDAGTENSSARISGFADAIGQYPNLTIVERQETISTEEGARLSTHQLLRRNPDLAGIATFNEIITVGMGKALVEAEGQDMVCVGFDNNALVMDYLETGVLDAVVLQNQFAMGYLGAQYALECIAGTVKEKTNIDTGVQVVTRENMFDAEIQPLLYPFDTEQMIDDE